MQYILHNPYYFTGYRRQKVRKMNKNKIAFGLIASLASFLYIIIHALEIALK